MAERERDAAPEREAVVRVAATDKWVMHRREATMPDGRRITYYTFQPVACDGERADGADER